MSEPEIFQTYQIGIPVSVVIGALIVRHFDKRRFEAEGALTLCLMGLLWPLVVTCFAMYGFCRALAWLMSIGR